MYACTHFVPDVAQAETALQHAEEASSYRNSPSLFASFRSSRLGQPGGDRHMSHIPGAVVFSAACASLALCLSGERPHAIYPSVWVLSRVNPLPERSGLHAWIHEVWVGQGDAPIPMDAALVYHRGSVLRDTPAELKVGLTERYDSNGRDQVIARQAWLYHWPHDGLGGPQHAVAA